MVGNRDQGESHIDRTDERHIDSPECSEEATPLDGRSFLELLRMLRKAWRSRNILKALPM